MERRERHVAKLVRKNLLQLRIIVLPESLAARDHILPQPRLAFVHTGRCAMPERRALKRSVHALLVHRMSGFVDGRERRIAEVAFVHPRGDTHITQREGGAERVMRQVEPTARGVVTHLTRDLETELELRLLRENLT